jgi:hypothetical protein
MNLFQASYVSFKDYVIFKRFILLEKQFFNRGRFSCGIEKLLPVMIPSKPFAVIIILCRSEKFKFIQNTTCKNFFLRNSVETIHVVLFNIKWEFFRIFLSFSCS